MLFSKCLNSSALPQPILNEKETHAHAAVRQQSTIHQPTGTIHQQAPTIHQQASSIHQQASSVHQQISTVHSQSSATRQQSVVDLGSNPIATYPNVHQPKHHQQSAGQQTVHYPSTGQTTGQQNLAHQPANPTRQQSAHLEPSRQTNRNRAVDQPRGSSGDASRVIFPAEEDPIMFTNSSEAPNYELINKNPTNARNSKNAETPTSSLNQSSDATNLAMPELAPNGKPRCLGESSFYCESVDSYPK